MAVHIEDQALIEPLLAVHIEDQAVIKPLLAVHIENQALIEPLLAVHIENQALIEPFLAVHAKNQALIELSVLAGLILVQIHHSLLIVGLTLVFLLLMACSYPLFWFWRSI